MFVGLDYGTSYVQVTEHDTNFLVFDAVNRWFDPIGGFRDDFAFRCFCAEPDGEELSNQMMRLRTLSVASLSVFSMFGERGIFSGHPYQPEVNHRSMNFASLHEHTFNEDLQQSDPPLIHSMVAPTPKMDFSNGAQIGFFFYEIAEGPAVDPCSYLKSQDSMSINFPDCVPVFCGSGRLINRFAKFPSFEGFTRALWFFGYEWHEKNSNGERIKVDEKNKRDPKLEELYLFASLFRRYNMKDDEDVMSIIQDFSLEALFRVNEDDHIEDTRRYLFQLIGSYMPLRIGVFDGKHRKILCDYFSIGYYNPRNSIDLKSRPFRSFETVQQFAGINCLDVKYESMQLFTLQTIQIGVPSDMTSIKAAFKIMEDYGQVKTAAAVLTIRESLVTAFSEFLTYAGHRDMLKNVRELTYDEYWMKNPPSVIEQNGIILFEAMIAFIEHRNKVEFFKGDVSCTWAETKAEMKRHICSLDFPYSANDYQKLNKVGKDLSIILVVCKYVLQHVPNMNLIRRWLQRVAPEKKNKELPPTIRGAFYSSKWMKDIFIRSLHIAVCHIGNKVLIEKKQIHTLRNLSANIALANDLDKEWPKLPNFLQTNVFKVPIKTSQWTKYNDSDKSLAASKSREFGRKLQFSLSQKIFEDAFKCLVEFGLNPQYTPVMEEAHENKLLCLYLK